MGGFCVAVEIHRQEFGRFIYLAYICINQTETEMATKRKTGDDYIKELTELDNAKTSLKAHTTARLRELIKRYPDAIVIDNNLKNFDNFLCKDIKEAWLDTMTTLEVIRYIQNIEKWLAGKEKLKQLTIDEIYNEIPDEIKRTLKKLSD
jgi:hypothetical protein